MSDQEFLDLICNAYRELRNLPPEAPIEYKIGVYPNGTIQVTLKEGKP